MKVTDDKKVENQLSRKEIRIRNVADTIHTPLKNIAKNIGMSFDAFMKMELRNIVNKYPEKERLPILPDQDH